MTIHLDTFQVNMLLTGRDLCAVIPSSREDHRLVITVCGYEEDSRRPWGRASSVFLNGDHSNTCFRFQVDEVSAAELEYYLGYDEWGKTVVFRNGIASLDELHEVIGYYLDDFAVLVSSIKQALERYASRNQNQERTNGR